jgi:hypothetical protein
MAPNRFLQRRGRSFRVDNRKRASRWVGMFGSGNHSRWLPGHFPVIEKISSDLLSMLRIGFRTSGNEAGMNPSTASDPDLLPIS